MYERDLAELKDFNLMPDFIIKIVNECTPDKIGAIIPADVFRNARRIIFTGNGDSYASSVAVRFFYQHLLKMSDVTTERCIEAGRHLYFQKDEDPSATIVFVTSASGTGARVTEVARRAAAKGCTVIANTANPESHIAKAATYTVPESLEKVWDFRYSGQSFSFTNGLLDLMLIGLYAALCRGTITAEEEKAYRTEIIRYAESFKGEFDRIDEQMYKLALLWERTTSYDFVGAGPDFASAYFGAAKFFEYSGTPNMFNDSEDWNHINYFVQSNETTGTCIVTASNSDSLSRTMEVTHACSVIGRPTLLVSELPEDAVPENVTYCRLPDTDIPYIKTLFNYIPFTLLGFHLARMRGKTFFAALTSLPAGVVADTNRVKTSEIIMID